MPLAPTLPLVEAARRQGRAVLAVNVSNAEMLQGAVAAATAAGRPLIVQFNRAGLAHLGGAALAGTLARAVAAAAPVPVALHLDHAATLDELRAAIEAGFTSLMLDGSTLALPEHTALVREARALATAAALPLEAELGHVPGVEAGVTLGAGALTDPAEAARFVEATGVDLLAVSIGNVHGTAPAGMALDLARLVRIRAATPVPLVLHGASGVPGSQLAAAAARGVAKVNVGTGVHRAFAEGLGDALATAPQDARAALAAARAAVERAVSGQITAAWAVDAPSPA